MNNYSGTGRQSIAVLKCIHVGMKHNKEITKEEREGQVYKRMKTADSRIDDGDRNAVHGAEKRAGCPARGPGAYAYLKSCSLNKEPLSSTVRMCKVVQHHEVPFCKMIIRFMVSVYGIKRRITYERGGYVRRTVRVQTWMQHGKDITEGL